MDGYASNSRKYFKYNHTHNGDSVKKSGQNFRSLNSVRMVAESAFLRDSRSVDRDIKS